MFAQTHVCWVSDAIKPSHPLSSPAPLALNLPSWYQGLIPMSQLFASGDQSIGASASASVLPMISFRIDMFDCLAVQGTLKGLLQHHNSKVSILWCSAFFVVWLAHLYMTTGKTVALTRQTFVHKGMALLFNMLSRFVIAFLPKSKCRLISWLQLPSAVIFGAQEKKICHCVHLFPIYLPWSDGIACHDLSFLNVEF